MQQIRFPRRKTAVFSVFVVWIAGAVLVAASASARELTGPVAIGGQPIFLNRTMAFSDPNRDPNWDWTINTTYTLQTHSQTFNGVRLPYYSNSGPAAAILNDSAGRDIEPEDGWVLVLRDFGPVPVPFYILYNKYRGVLRIFFFSTLQSTYSSAVGRLTFQDTTTARTGAHFTLSEKSIFLDSYDPARSQVSVGKIQPQQWGFFDFDVSGYDPGITGKSDPTFVFDLAGVTQSDLTATGEVDLTTGPVSTMANMRPGNTFVDSVFNTIDNVNKRHKSVTTFRTTIDQQVANNPTAWWAAPLNLIQGLTSKSWFGALGPVAGFLEFALGGGSRNSSLPAPLATEGTVTLRGQISTETSIYTLIFRAPGSIHLTPGIDELSNVLPLYDTPLGLFNVTTRPWFDVTVVTSTSEDLPSCPWTVDVDSHATTALQVVFNPYVFSSSSISVTWAPLYHPAEQYVSVSSFNSSWSRMYSGEPEDEDLYIDLTSGSNFFDRIAVRATLYPQNPASGLEPVKLYKTYDVFSFVSVYGNGECEGGGGEYLFTPGPIGPGPVDGSLGDGLSGAPLARLLELAREQQKTRLGDAPVTETDAVVDYLVVLLEHAANGDLLSWPLSEVVREDFRRHLVAVGGPALDDAELRWVEQAAFDAITQWLRGGAGPREPAAFPGVSGTGE